MGRLLILYLASLEYMLTTSTGLWNGYNPPDILIAQTTEINSLNFVPSATGKGFRTE